MRRTRSIIILVVAAALAAATVVLTTGPADAGAEPVKFSGSKAKNGPFNKTNIHFELDPGEVRTVYLRAKNTANGGLPLPVTMARAGDDPDLALKWFKGRGSGGTDITAQVEAGTYSFDLPAGKARHFRWRIKQLTTNASCAGTVIEYPDVGQGGVFVNARGNCG